MPATNPENWLVGGGEMGKLVRSMDWAKTPLGPISGWPQSLRTTVSLCLASNFPISLAWGKHHTQIYNDGYWPITGGKHPGSVGQDFSECWASAWPVIGDSFERALAGETSFLENQRMFLDRNGYLEETFFTFSFSPIRDETGGVGGLFHPVTETTANMLGERRTRVLRDLAARAGNAHSRDEALVAAASTLAACDLDVPFALFYAMDGGGTEPRLVAKCGVAPDAASGSAAGTASSPAGWPLAGVAGSGAAVLIDNLPSRFGAFASGPYPEPSKQALMFPIPLPGAERAPFVMITGVSSRLPLNEAYRAFYDLLASSVASAVASANAYEEERKRAEALAEIDRAKTAFFSNVSHEFRTPLTLMLGPIEDELNETAGSLPAPRRERLEVAHRNTLRLLKLVNTLLDFSRIEAGRIHARFEPTELAHYTAELASGFRSAIEKGGLILSVDCPPLPAPVYVDREMWEKIVLNLLSNAFKHTFAGEIGVRLAASGDQVELEIRDTGIGVSADELPRLFDRFHRVKGARARTHEGTGIGLALVQELVKAHGGTVRVESTEGIGTRFFVVLKTGRAHLPADKIGAGAEPDSTATRATAYFEEALHWIAHPQEIAAPAASVASVSPAPSGRISGAARDGNPAAVRPRILWADDNADMREYVSRLLSTRYRVEAVADGEQALAAALDAPPDLVLSDVMMPGLDGFGLLRQLRAHAETKTIPVILLSARAGEESSIEGLDAGADDYLVKPFVARELLARVRTHLEMAKLRRQWERQLKAANKELESFSYTISHDLRSPLRGIAGFTGILQEEFAPQLPDGARRYLALITENTNRMDRLIDDLLNFARLGQGNLACVRVDMTGLAGGVVEELRKSEPSRSLEFRLAELPDGVGDRSLIRQVFVNLLTNALKFTRPRDPGIIEIGSAVTDAGEMYYFVKDNGVGFDMTKASRLFGVFERLHGYHEFEGTGIGLSTAQRILQRHGGRIWAEAELGKGAKFCFTLPGV
ncbi:MAG: Chemotaxis protein methyltransferase CheR [Rariglobus sp.]|jgi:signal transduction histidine kinase|nr:Chemotaxis protein methyltransferase CheR [Rariglobus sp.]